MSKGLDLIQRQQPEIIDGFPTGNIYIGVTKEELTELEKELKALDIIKNKQVHVARVNKCDNVLQYNMGTTYEERFLTEEEYNLLKEVLL